MPETDLCESCGEPVTPDRIFCTDCTPPNPVEGGA